MPARKPKVMVAAEPKYGNHFDPWHSASTGHQRPEPRLPIVAGWRESRSIRLTHQLKSGDTGGNKVFDPLTRGSENREKEEMLDQADSKPEPQKSVVDTLRGKEPVPLAQDGKPTSGRNGGEPMKMQQNLPERKRGIFDGLVIYINGSTYPLISDHKLKQVLAENGAKLAFHLGRKQVTHVILGKPTGTRGSGAGGGLAGAKLDKEIKKVGGYGVKYVGVEWVLASLKAGKRQAETPFVNLKIASKGQQSVYSLFKKPGPSSPAASR